MTSIWWACRTCGQELYDSQGVYAHRHNTGHNDAALVTEKVGAGPGSTDEGRAAARALFEQMREASK
jgi:hypothetical protein